jgi:hypothetical protein
MAMSNPPEEISVYVDWHFELSAPKEKDRFFAAVRNYQSENDSALPWHIKIYQKLIRTSLSKKIGTDRLTIIYEYSTEQGSGEWLDHEDQLVIQNQSGVSVGDILFSLHHETENKLHGQDIMAIEGLEIKEGSEDEEYPAYYVFFGS